ncbi:MAG: NAD-dependent epimerase/dehydratase family protein, partial [Bacteroidia bacterium]|nr:NAD-dependent epimerase/dehydratase family protein [Bacteroidia bacterium]
IGSNLTKTLLDLGASKVVVADNLLTGFRKNIEGLSGNMNLEVKIGDLAESSFCDEVTKNIDVVFHQAALGSVPRSIEDPLKTHTCNITGFLNTLDAAKRNGVSKFIYASSSSVYGDDSHLPKEEKFIGNPLSPYAVSKVANELYASVYASLHKMQITGLRYFNVFGPNQSPGGQYSAVIPRFIESMALNKEIVIYGDGEQKRDFTFVENVMSANIKVLAAEPANVWGKVFNIAAGEPNSVNTLFTILAEKLEYKNKPVYLAERSGDIKNSYADISLASQMINYSPLFTLGTGLDLTIPWVLSGI